MSTDNDTYAAALEVALAALDALCRQKLDAADAALIDPKVDTVRSADIVGQSTGATEAYMTVMSLLNQYRREQYLASRAGVA